MVEYSRVPIQLGAAMIGAVLVAGTGCATTVEMARRECESAGYGVQNPKHRLCVQRVSQDIDARAAQAEADAEQSLRSENWPPNTSGIRAIQLR